MNHRLRKIVGRLRIEPLGVAMPGPRLPQRIRNIIDAAPITQISRIRAGYIVTVCVALCASFASGTLGHAQQAPAAETSATTAITAQPSPDSTKLRFDAASLKERGRNEPDGIIGMQIFPGRLVELCASLNDLVWYAYHITWARPEGLPDWARKACAAGSPEYTYDFQATMPPDTTTDQTRQMMQGFLAERFKLAAHWEKRQVSVYALVVARGGLKVKPFDRKNGPPSPAKFACPPEDPACHRMLMASRGAGQLAAVLGNTIGRPVLDKTGLMDTDTYIFDLRWAGDMSADSPLPSLADALRDDFGLELKSETAPADVLVIDHAEQPTPN